LEATFEEFWELYPRRVAKAHARKMWSRLGQGDKFKALHALPVHVRYWKAAGREYERIPHPGSWLGGERWEDELEMPEAKSVVDAWWASDEGIQRKALSLGMSPRPGESWPNLKARIIAELDRRKAA
jgi:hypothetical protein